MFNPDNYAIIFESQTEIMSLARVRNALKRQYLSLAFGLERNYVAADQLWTTWAFLGWL